MGSALEINLLPQWSPLAVLETLPHFPCRPRVPVGIQPLWEGTMNWVGQLGGAAHVCWAHAPLLRRGSLKQRFLDTLSTYSCKMSYPPCHSSRAWLLPIHGLCFLRPSAPPLPAWAHAGTPEQHGRTHRSMPTTGLHGRPCPCRLPKDTPSWSALLSPERTRT